MPKIQEFYCRVSMTLCSVSCQQLDFCTCQTDLTCVDKQNQYQISKHWREEMLFACCSLCYLLIAEERRGLESMLSTGFGPSTLPWAGDPSRSLNIHLHISLCLDPPYGFLTSFTLWYLRTEATCNSHSSAEQSPLLSPSWCLCL